MRWLLLLIILALLTCRWSNLEHYELEPCSIYCDDKERGGLDRLEFALEGTICICENGEAKFLYSLQKKNK